MDEALAMREKGMSYRAIAKKTGVSKATVCLWIANFAKPKVKSVMEEAPNQPSGAPDAPTSGSLEEQVKELREKLRQTELRADLYREIITVAEAKFKIQLLKKAGARQ